MQSEVENYKYLYECIADDSLKNRARISLEYYITKASLYQTAWNWLSVVGIVLPAIATIFAGLGLWPWLIALITALTTIASGLLALFKCADKKTSYRNSAENLKSELSAYLSHTGSYREDEQANNELLAENIERIIREGYDKITELEKQQR